MLVAAAATWKHLHLWFCCLVRRVIAPYRQTAENWRQRMQCMRIHVIDIYTTTASAVFFFSFFCSFLTWMHRLSDPLSFKVHFRRLFHSNFVVIVVIKCDLIICWNFTILYCFGSFLKIYQWIDWNSRCKFDEIMNWMIRILICSILHWKNFTF